MSQGIGFHTSGILIDSPKLATDEDMLNFLAMQPDFRGFNQVSEFGSRCNNCNNYIALAPFPTRLEWAGCIHDCFQSFNVAQVTWHVSCCLYLKTPFTGLQGLESNCSRRWTDWWQQSHNTSSWAAFQRNSFPHSNVIQSECMWRDFLCDPLWSCGSLLQVSFDQGMSLETFFGGWEGNKAWITAYSDHQNPCHVMSRV